MDWISRVFVTIPLELLAQISPAFCICLSNVPTGCGREIRPPPGTLELKRAVTLHLDARQCFETDILCCLKSVSFTLSCRLAKLCLVTRVTVTPRSDRTENARPEVGVVTDVVTAVVRTVVRTIGRRGVRVVEHPAGDSNTDQRSQLNLAPQPIPGHACTIHILQYTHGAGIVSNAYAFD